MSLRIQYIYFPDGIVKRKISSIRMLLDTFKFFAYLKYCISNMWKYSHSCYILKSYLSYMYHKYLLANLKKSKL